MIFNHFSLINLLSNFKINCLSTQVYRKNVYFVRYLDSVFVGLIGSKSFVFFLQKKISTFLISQLHFGIKEVDIFGSKENNILFMGFNVRFSSCKKYLSFNSLFTNKKYKSRILSRLVKFQKRTDKMSLERFSSEFFINIGAILNTRKICSSSFSSKKLWSCIFQFEAVRVTRISKLILTNDKQSSVPSETFSVIRELSINKYQKYSFDVYHLRMQILLKDILKNFYPLLSNSILPIDLVLTQYFSEFKKKIILLYGDYNLKNPLLSKSSFDKNLHQLSPMSYTNVMSILNLNKRYSNRISIINDDRLINFFIPFDFLFLKLRSLGFIHPYKNRPIGNAKFLFFEDSFIIKSFGYFAYSMLHWYRFCKNLNNLRSIVELIRESCFLTLCRKHNKSKSWAYITYTSDLVILRGLFDTKSFFPTRKFMLKLNKKKAFYVNFHIDEKFFLES